MTPPLMHWRPQLQPRSEPRASKVRLGTLKVRLLSNPRHAGSGRKTADSALRRRLVFHAVVPNKHSHVLSAATATLTCGQSCKLWLTKLAIIAPVASYNLQNAQTQRRHGLPGPTRSLPATDNVSWGRCKLEVPGDSGGGHATRQMHFRRHACPVADCWKSAPENLEPRPRHSAAHSSCQGPIAASMLLRISA